MRQQIRGHESSITVSADAYAISISNAHLYDFVDCGFRTGDKLIDVMIVCGLARTDDGHRRIVENRITGQQQKLVRITGHQSKSIG